MWRQLLEERSSGALKEGTSMLRKLKALLRSRQGQTMVEYALILVLVAIAAIVILGTMGDAIVTVFTDIVTALTS